MKVQIERSFPMPAGADIVWSFLQDVEAVAGCMPGAKIAERVDERHFKGTVSVRVGPATMLFRGTIEVTALDAAAMSLRLLGKGTDSTGTSGASMDLAARVESSGTGSNLVGRSEVSMSGKAATFGGRVMGALADQILKQFAENFAAQVAAFAVATTQGAPGPAGPARPESPPRAINALALLWAMIRDWLRALLGKSPA